MKTQVEFRSSKFPPYEGGARRDQSGLWGKRLAEYFVRKLSEKGIKTRETNISRSLVISLPGHCIDQTNEKTAAGIS